MEAFLQDPPVLTCDCVITKRIAGGRSGDMMVIVVPWTSISERANELAHCQTGRDELDNWLSAERQLVLSQLKNLTDDPLDSLGDGYADIILLVEVEDEQMNRDYKAATLALVKDVDGNTVGYIERTSVGPVRVHLEHPWEDIMCTINGDVELGNPLVGRDGQLQIIQNSSDKEVAMVSDAIRTLSDLKLVVVSALDRA